MPCQIYSFLQQVLTKMWLLRVVIPVFLFKFNCNFDPDQIVCSWWHCTSHRFLLTLLDFEVKPCLLGLLNPCQCNWLLLYGLLCFRVAAWYPCLSFFCWMLSIFRFFLGVHEMSYPDCNLWVLFSSLHQFHSSGCTFRGDCLILLYSILVKNSYCQCRNIFFPLPLFSLNKVRFPPLCCSGRLRCLKRILLKMRKVLSLVESCS